MNIAFENDVYMQIYTVDDKRDVDYDDADDHLHIQSEWGILDCLSCVLPEVLTTNFLTGRPLGSWLMGQMSWDRNWFTSWCEIWFISIAWCNILLGVTLPVFQWWRFFRHPRVPPTKQHRSTASPSGCAMIYFLMAALHLWGFWI